MNRIHQIIAPALVAALAAGFAGVASAQTTTVPVTQTQPVNGQQWRRGDCRSGHNLSHVRRRLDGVIDQLNHDQKDYGGHRVTAISDLQAARTEITTAEQTATTGKDQGSGCNSTHGPSGGSEKNWGMRGQNRSNSNLRTARRKVERLIDEMQHDQSDYSGHKAAAIADLQRARQEIVAGEQFDKSHGVKPN